MCKVLECSQIAKMDYYLMLKGRLVSVTCAHMSKKT